VRVPGAGRLIIERRAGERGHVLKVDTAEPPESRLVAAHELYLLGGARLGHRALGLGNRVQCSLDRLLWHARTPTAAAATAATAVRLITQQLADDLTLLRSGHNTRRAAGAASDEERVSVMRLDARQPCTGGERLEHLGMQVVLATDAEREHK
jgi:hypothetical protein